MIFFKDYFGVHYIFHQILKKVFTKSKICDIIIYDHLLRDRTKARYPGFLPPFSRHFGDKIIGGEHYVKGS